MPRHSSFGKWNKKKGRKSTVLALEIDFVEKTSFFRILGLFDPLAGSGGGSKFLKNYFSSLHIICEEFLPFKLKLIFFCQTSHNFDGHVIARSVPFSLQSHTCLMNFHHTALQTCMMPCSQLYFISILTVTWIQVIILGFFRAGLIERTRRFFGPKF